MDTDSKLPNYQAANLKIFEDITNSIIEDFMPRDLKDYEKMASIINKYIHFFKDNLIKDELPLYEKDYNKKIENKIQKLEKHLDTIKHANF